MAKPVAQAQTNAANQILDLEDLLTYAKIFGIDRGNADFVVKAQDILARATVDTLARELNGEHGDTLFFVMSTVEAQTSLRTVMAEALQLEHDQRLVDRIVVLEHDLATSEAEKAILDREYEKVGRTSQSYKESFDQAVRDRDEFRRMWEESEREREAQVEALKGDRDAYEADTTRLKCWIADHMLKHHGEEWG